MPPPATLDELLDLVRRVGAADDEDVERFRIDRPSDELGTAEAGGRALIRAGLLTPFQVQHLLRAEIHGLRIADRYRILDNLGGGGMGRVFLATDLRTGQPVAIKMMAGSLSQVPQAIARFQREARAAARIHHPAIVPVLEAGEDGNQLYLAMEFVDGADLNRYVGACGALESATAAFYVIQAAEALQAAADHGWVHRDVKPHNLIIDRTGRLRLLDLGLARPCEDDSSQLQVTDPSAADTILGTADFIAPEQVDDSSAVDGRADIYGLGATFYFLLAGRPPLPEGEASEKLAWLRSNDPVPIRELRPEVPIRMAEVLATMMAKVPADRFQAPREVSAALAPWSAEPPLAPNPAGLRDWSPAVRRLLGLPVGETVPVSPSLVLAMPSSFSPHTAQSVSPGSRALPGWAAFTAIVVGVVTALLLGLRSPAAVPAPTTYDEPRSADERWPGADRSDRGTSIKPVATEHSSGH